LKQSSIELGIIRKKIGVELIVVEDVRGILSVRPKLSACICLTGIDGVGESVVSKRKRAARA